MPLPKNLNFPPPSQILACFLASAAAIPIEDTEDVKMAKAMFYKAFNDAEMGKLADLQEPQIPNGREKFLNFLSSHYRCVKEV